MTAMCGSCVAGVIDGPADESGDDDALPRDGGSSGTPDAASGPDGAPGSDAATTSDAGSGGTEGVWTGVDDTMWAEIETQRAVFGDPNDCHARISGIPTSGYSLSPCDGNCINDALSSHETVVLQAGTYSISRTVGVGDRNLIGAPGQLAVIDASGVDTAVSLGAGVVSNVTIVDAENFGIDFADDGLAYLVSIARTGWSEVPNDTGDSFSLYNSKRNCIVSTEAYDGYNEEGGSATADGGQSNCYTLSTTATADNTLIDSHGYRCSDEGFDFWEGGTVYMYFCSAFDNGKPTDRPGGDGDGVKLGQGSAMHYLYKVKSYDNLLHGFDINGNSIPSTLIQCEAWGNEGQDYVGVTNQN